MLDTDTGQIAMVLLPKGKKSCYRERREWLQIPEMVRLDQYKRAWEVGNLCHLSFSGYPQGKGAGETLKYGPATQNMYYKEQFLEETNGITVITTVLKCDRNCQVHHILS